MAGHPIPASPSGARALFVLRRGGLPFDLIDELRTTDLADWHEQGRTLAAATATVRSQLDEYLAGRVIPAARDEARRHAINLRRAIRAGRLPATATGPAAEIVARHPDLGAALHWLADGVARQRDHDDLGETILAKESGRIRGALSAAAGHPELRRGILLQSADLDSFLDGYDQTVPAGKRARRLDRSLLTYLYRSAAKTSPFSTLGVVGVGVLATPEAGAPETGATAMTLRSGPGTVAGGRLNLGVIGRVIDLINQSDQLLRDVPLVLNSSVRSVQSRMRYIRRLRRAARSDAPVDMGQVSESVFYLGDEHVAAEVVSAFADGRRLTSGQAAAILADQLAGRASAELIVEYLHALTRVGFLVAPLLSIDINSATPVADFADRLGRLTAGWARQTARLLVDLDGLADRYVAADLPGRRDIDKTMRERLAGIEDLLGGSHRLRSLETIVFEDVADPGISAQVDTRWWRREVLPVLEDYGQLLGLYDPSGPMRLAMAAYFKARHGLDGVESDAITFLHEFGQDCFDQLQQAMLGHQDFAADNTFRPLPNWFRLPQIDRIGQAKVRIREHLQGLVDAGGAGAGPIDLGADWLRREADRVREIGLSDADPRSFFVQIARAAPPLAVLNKSYCGMGLHFSRFARLLDQAGDVDVTGYVRERNRSAGDAVVYAELRGGMDTTNLNLHPRLTDFELVAPGERSFRPAAEQIALESLQIRCRADGSGLFLWSPELAVRVVPAYLGFLLPFALPTMQQTLLLFSATNMAMPDLWRGVDMGGDHHRPRLQIGSVVLRRRSWFTDPTGLPDATPGRSGSARYRGWRIWQAGQGLPDQVFLQPRPGGPAGSGPAGETDGQVRATTAAKPQFVDFTSEPSVRLLDHQVRRRAGEIEFVEMLPDRDQLWADERTGRRYVTELTIDINAPGDGAPHGHGGSR